MGKLRISEENTYKEYTAYSGKCNVDATDSPALTTGVISTSNSNPNNKEQNDEPNHTNTFHIGGPVELCEAIHKGSKEIPNGLQPGRLPGWGNTILGGRVMGVPGILSEVFRGQRRLRHRLTPVYTTVTGGGRAPPKGPIAKDSTGTTES